MMTLVYPIENKLYVNLTNRCTNDCNFCVRSTTDNGMGYDLWLDREPTVDEVKRDLDTFDLAAFEELVFCGYGEPTERFFDLITLARYAKEKRNIPIRINTNGHANVLAGSNVAPMMQGLIDCLSVSLNAPTAAKYQEICRCQYGAAGFEAMLDFVRCAKPYVPHIVLSVVDSIGSEAVEQCRTIAQEMGVDFRVRRLIV